MGDMEILNVLQNNIELLHAYSVDELYTMCIRGFSMVFIEANGDLLLPSQRVDGLNSLLSQLWGNIVLDSSRARIHIMTNDLPLESEFTQKYRDLVLYRRRVVTYIRNSISLHPRLAPFSTHMNSVISRFERDDNHLVEID